VSLAPGARFGSYQVVALLGAGGMGEVYRARDTKLGRDVAIKVLPPAVASDPERVARFEREAKTLAALNHPRIAHIHGFEDSTGIAALVMELVEGSTLAERIDGLRSGLPIAEALAIAKQIAEGLEAAHDHGIVHRDLKPANIKVSDDGQVKILDFGLAKAVDAGQASGGASGLSMSPTLTTPAQMTGLGTVLGTAAYMSPEQAKGRPVDKRADVWAFGAVLFEMLTGKRCFEGDDVSDTMAAILRSAPEWSALPANTPAAIRRLLRRCLEKDVRSRLSDMAMVRVELRDAETEPEPAVGAAPAAALSPKTTVVRRAAPYAAAVAAALVSGIVVWRARQPVERPQPIARFSIEGPDQAQLNTLGRNPIAISPDGTHLVYVLNQRLYLRTVDQLEGAPIAGTQPVEPIRFPFFSPDGQSIAYWQNNQLRKIGLNGGAPVTICEINSVPFTASWESDGRILLGMGSGGIVWVPATGGTPATLISMKNGDRAFGPQVLPGGEWLLFTLGPAGTSTEQGRAVVQSLATSERRTVLEGVRETRYLPSGHLVFGRGNTLLAQPFDVRRGTVSGGPVSVLDGVLNGANTTPAMYFAVSSTGTLFYLPGRTVSVTTLTKLIQVTRDGARTVLADVPGMSWFPRFSPDGARVAYGISGGSDLGDTSDLWVLDVSRGARTRVTFTGNNRFYPIWSRDGARLTHADGSAGTNRLLRTPADGSGTSETLIDTGPRVFPTSWSPDGRALAIYTNGPTNTRDVAIVQKNGDKWTSTPFIATPFEERGAVFSPSGRWLAYVSNKTGQNDVFARPYPGPGAEVTISAGGGQEPVWAPSGKELFYRHDGKLVSVRIDETPTTLTVSAPARVFDDVYRLDTGGASGGMANYDISPDGKRFVMIEEPKAGSAARETLKFTVVLNWIEELKARVPTK